MLNARTSTIGGAGLPASAGSVQREQLPFLSKAQALSALGLGLLLVLGALAAVVAVRRRRRATAHCAALLAGSAPIGLSPASGGLASARGAVDAGANGAFAAEPARPSRAWVSDAAPRPSRALLSDEETPSRRGVSPAERSSPRAAAAPSGINVPPPSERQWQSQPPPRIGKDPPG
jgi:hypothetical protein